MPLDRDHVLRVALDLMDRVGLEGLTLRKLAAELGVQAPALYWHFTNKQALLDQMAEAMVRNDHPSVPPMGPGRPWDEWLRDEAHARRAVLVGRRDAALLAARTKPPDSAFSGVERELAGLVEAGFTPADALMAIFTVGNYVAGFALEEQAEEHEEHSAPDGPAEVTQEQLDQWIDQTLEGLPMMAAAVRVVGDPQGDDAFAHGIETIIMGLRARLAAIKAE